MKISSVSLMMLCASTAAVKPKMRGLRSSNRRAQEDVVNSIHANVDSLWEAEGLPGLTEAIAIDSQSPNFNPDWAETGELHAILDFYLQHATEKLGSRTNVSHKVYGGANATFPTPPLLTITVEGSRHGQEGAPEVLLYTHADTQPHNGADWTHGDPLVATRVNASGDLLYGRGTTDDKYAFFSAVIMFQTLMEQGLPYPTVHIVVETEEESGSPHLEPHLDELVHDIGSPDVVYVLDSGGPDQSHMWNTRSLRGLISGVLRVELLESSVHSGTAGGIVPSVFRLMNNIISDRIEERNGDIIAAPLVHNTSDIDKAAALSLAEVMGDTVFSTMPWLEGTSPMPDGSTPTTQDIADMLVRNSYQPALAIIGWDHAVMPALDKGGNVVQPYIEAKLSIRCSPYTDVFSAAEELKRLIEAPPHAHGANVTFTIGGTSPGFAADPLPAWYQNIVNEAAVPIFGAEMLDVGKGGTIGFLATIQKKLEGSIIHNTGLFAPSSKGHAPDESLDIEAVKKFTSVMTYTLQSLMTADRTVEEEPTTVGRAGDGA
ncbi:peptidase, M20 [Seminavis robusta]|uniref:Peptidase, M20 n=1 Tax=Seminavis robusta TaxID=568900 RepID=A0A9N8HHB6_9STRA|nr:peptidase, M20 [Seminavis robusta]|eukprot:Sro527_g160750.1 peptidase, M20 (545) ;mRNA; r:49819-51453